MIIFFSFIIFFLFSTALADEYELYKTILNALISSGNVEEALEVAKKGTELFPEDPYWWEVYSELLIWNNKKAEAIKALIKAGRLSGRKDLVEKAFITALEAKRYDIAKELLPEIDTSLENILKIYEGLGETDRIIELLKEEEEKRYLYLLLDMLYFLGRKKEALKVIEKIEGKYGRETNLIVLKSRILYADRRFSEALKVLKDHENYIEEDNIEFWRNLSDLAWLMEDYETSLRASLKLINLGKGRDIDYQRVFLIVIHKDTDKALSIAERAYKDTSIEYVLERGIYLLYEDRKWTKLIDFVNKLKNIDRSLVNENISALYITALHRLNKPNKLSEFAEGFLKSNKSSILLSQYIYILIEREDREKLKNILKRYYRNYKNDPLAVKSFISLYIALGYPYKAYILYEKKGIKDNILKAEILYAIGKKKEALFLKYKEFMKLKNQFKNDPQSLYNMDFMLKYLYLGIEFLSYKQYKRILTELKDIMPEDIWIDLLYSLLIYHSKYNEIEYLYKRKSYKTKGWIKIAMYLQGYNIALKGLHISNKDKAFLWKKKKNFDMAVYYLFKSMKEAPYDINLKYEFYNLYRLSKDSVEALFHFRNWLNYEELRSSFIYRNKKGFDISLTIINPTRIYFPTGYKLEVSYKKDKDKYKFKFAQGILNKGDSVPFFNFNIFAKFKRSTNIYLSFDLNKEPLETAFLYLNSLKDNITSSLNLKILKKTYLNISLEISNYKYYDYKYIGYSDSIKAGINHRFEKISFLGISLYGESKSFKGKGNILPDSYRNIGIFLHLSKEHRLSYVLKPFLNAGIGYNDVYGSVISVSTGLSGSLVGNDTINLYANFSRNTLTVGEYLISVKMGYTFLF